MARRFIGIPVVLASVLLACGCMQVGLFGPKQIREVRVEASPRFFELNRVAIIDIDGFISSGRTSWLSLSGTSTADVKEKLDRAALDSSVRAVVLRINSPGGEASASDTLLHEIDSFKKNSGKPVVAALMGTAASGGYYVALGGDRIVATPTCITGSVGVLMRFLNVEGLYGKYGLRSEVIKSGDKKDIASSTRPMTDAEREILESVNRALFDRFRDAVRTHRKGMTPDDLARISDGRILTAEQAKELHMVDDIGHLDDAIAEARRLAGIKTSDVILYTPSHDHNSNIYAQAAARGDLILQSLNVILRRRGPTFLYLWSPGP